MSHSTQAAPAPPKTKRPVGLFVAGGIVVILAAVIGIWLGTRDSSPELTAGDENAVSETVVVENEFGERTEQLVVDAQYRQKLSIFLTEVDPELSEDQWLSVGIPELISADLTQNPFINSATPMQFLARVQREGSKDGQGLSQALKRKIARDRMSPWFVSSKLDRNERSEYRLELTLHETESGRAKEARVIERADLFELADAASVAIRQDLQVPEVLANQYPDLPVTEIMTDSPEAYKNLVLGATAISVDNDYVAAGEYLDAAVTQDSTFAMAHFLNWAATNATQDSEGIQRSGEAMMRYAYRLPDRMQYAVKANYYLNIQKDPEKAFAVTKMWTQLHPDDENGYRQLAAFHALRNERREQIVALEEVLRIDPSNYGLMHSVAEVYQDLGQFDDAAEWMQKYVDAFPDRPDGYEELGELYLDMGERDAAMQQFERARLMDDRRIDTILGMGLIHLREGRYTEADAEYSEALRIATTGTDRARIREQRTVLNQRLGRIEDAMQEQEAMLAATAEVVPPTQLAISRLAGLDLYLDLGRAEEALEIAELASTQLTEQIMPARALGTVPVYVALERAKDARADLEALDEFVNTYRVDRIRPVLDTMLANILDLEGDYAGAAALQEQAVANQPTSPSLKRRLATFLRKAGRLDDAQAQLEASLLLDPADPLTHLEYAQVEKARGNQGAAREHLDFVLAAWQEADPEFVDRAEALELMARLQD